MRLRAKLPVTSLVHRIESTSIYPRHTRIHKLGSRLSQQQQQQQQQQHQQQRTMRLGEKRKERTDDLTKLMDSGQNTTAVYIFLQISPPPAPPPILMRRQHQWQLHKREKSILEKERGLLLRLRLRSLATNTLMAERGSRRCGLSSISVRPFASSLSLSLRSALCATVEKKIPPIRRRIATQSSVA